MSRHLVPKYICEQLARDTTRALNLAPGLHWLAVREFAEPSLIPREDFTPHRYPDHLRPLIAAHLERELRMLYSWWRRPGASR